MPSSVGPFSGPVPSDLMKKVAEVVPKLQIQDIRLLNLNCRLFDNPPDTLAVDVEVNHTVTTATLGENILGVQVQFFFVVKHPENKNELVNISPTFQLVYEGENVGAIEEDKRIAFADFNAVFNAWPYLRELVQSLCGRMSIPTLTVPLLKRSLGSEKPEIAKNAPAEAHVPNG